MNYTVHPDGRLTLDFLDSGHAFDLHPAPDGPPLLTLRGAEEPPRTAPLALADPAQRASFCAGLNGAAPVVAGELVQVAKAVSKLHHHGEVDARLIADWDAPAPLADLPRPLFPTDTLPPTLRRFVEAEAIATQTPADMAALMSLAALATACGGRVVVRIGEDWTEPTNLFTCVAIEPGNRKTRVVADVVAPIEAYEAEQVKTIGPEIAKAQSRRKIAEQELSRAQQDAAKADNMERRVQLLAEADELAQDLAAQAVDPLPRLIVDDCSPEKVASLLAQHGGRLAVMTAEGGDIFELMAGRYGNGGPNFGVFLRGHAGDPIRVDRVGRPPEFVPQPALTMGLAVQPDVIRGLAGKPGFRGRGLLGRFAYAMPYSLVGRRAIDPPPVPASVRACYHTLIGELLERPAATAPDGSPTPHVLRLDDEARQTFRAFETALESRLGPYGDLHHIADWAAKLAGLVGRIAGVLHMAATAGGREPWAAPIPATTMAQAIRLGRDYLIPHALVAFAEMGADPSVENARYLLGWIQQRGWTEFRKRDLHQLVRARFRAAKDLDAPLAILADLGHLRERPLTERAGPGRKPSPVYDVNPKTLTQNTHNTQNDPRQANSEDCVHSVYGVAAPEPAWEELVV